MPVSPLSQYRADIAKALARGDDTEHTHRPALKALVEALASGVTATNEPKHVECGAPDYVVSRNTAHGPLTIGHIEAKDVGAPLASIEKSEQLKRYRKGSAESDPHRLPGVPLVCGRRAADDCASGECRQSSKIWFLRRTVPKRPRRSCAASSTTSLSLSLSPRSLPSAWHG